MVVPLSRTFRYALLAVTPFAAWFLAAPNGITGQTSQAATSSPRRSTSGPRVVTITATDYAFAGPAEIPAGLTTFRLVNGGHTLHHAQIVKLNEGKGAAEYAQAYIASFGTSGPEHGSLPSWALRFGGPAATDPGQTGDATATLEPGNYVLVCDIVLPDGIPHIKKGMMHAFRVVPSSAPSAPEPKADVVITLREYSFDLSAPLRAGAQTIRVNNTGREAHTTVLLQLVPGKTAEDFRKWAGTLAGPPPTMASAGGVEHMDGGRHAFFTAKLKPGEYVLVCFAADATGKPHLVEHRMVRQLSVR
ncbi:MAG: hypothetical protein ABJB66_12815 [Gemmatimonadaceae bacterium]